MIFSFLLSLLLGVLPLVLGCAQRAYRDPVTYSFEGKTPPPSSATEWHDVKKKAEETSKKVRAWEERYLW